MHNTNKILLGLAAALAMPMAFAQTTPTTEQDASAQSTPQETTPQQADSMASQSDQAQPKQVTWADLDGDKDGSLTKTEAAGIPALNAVFDQADANADGKLSAEEYRTFAAKSGKPKDGSSGG